MNLGQIPGYYWDTDKKKYFKVQANHVAPGDAKHAAANAKKEGRESKRRKVEQRRQEQRAEQTVRRSRIIRDPLIAGTALNRETGSKRPINDSLNSRDAAIVDHLRPTRINIPECFTGRTASLVDLQPLGDGRAAIAFSSAVHSCSIGTVPWPPYENSSPPFWSVKPTIHFNSALVSLHMVSDDSDTLPAVVAVTQQSKSPGNLYIGNRPSAYGELSRSNLFTLGHGESFLWSSSLGSNKEQLAISGSEDLFYADLVSGDVVRRLPLQKESRDVAWLDHNTVAYGQYDVQLWDIRSSGTAARFSRRHQPITGIRSPKRHGVQLLVADNRRLELYDTRMGKHALLSWPHLHQGPQIQLALHDEMSLVSAVDVNNDVRMYSLRSTRAVGTLRRRSDGHKALFTKLRWIPGDDDDPSETQGMVLQACQGNSVVQWSWGGEADDEG